MSPTTKDQLDIIPRVKLVIVGDGACGKTSLLHVLKYGDFSKKSCHLVFSFQLILPDSQIPTVFDTYVHNIQIDGKTIELALWDTAGQEEYERIRFHSYSRANVVLVAFAIDTRDSLENVTSEWIEEVNERCPDVPIILVGLKKDLRPVNITRNDRDFVHSKDAEIVASSIGARDYVECSSLTGEGVLKVFDIATRAGLVSFNLEPPFSIFSSKGNVLTYRIIQDPEAEERHWVLHYFITTSKSFTTCDIIQKC
ncbi:hypothetical protein INT43_002787 [Umbelopsis isabellina]|uniref:Uncharacterized protein n=1 Tax=Mortierella isabellina TaxID=91625 RepID=A0A8H7Q750_MORIS|nr:hypothetical protein INT43_002787 [Umbelopsis isabellina]